ncbi:Rec8 like protein-domain-containing protein [Terfezia claveryi]|nr:Rec8 like protein-domain-containing protein [Terfezia claveryi]
MFYSYEILTQRKYGVATVWLVATLGSRHGGPKLQRKDIMSVDVHKACDTIKNPEAPLALRLQSSLLYGVTKCYSQQYLYLYQDVKLVHANVRKLYTTSMNPLNLDLAASGKSRGPDQNVLQDDPGFLPGADLLVLGDLLDTGPQLEARFNNESLLTMSNTPYDPHTPSSSHSRHMAASHASRAITQIVDQSPSTIFGDHDFQMAGIDEAGQLEEVDYEFGEDGSMREIEPFRARERFSSEVDATPLKRAPVHPRAVRQGRERLASDDFVIAQVHRDHAEALDRPAEYAARDNEILAEAEPLPLDFDQEGDTLMQDSNNRPHSKLLDPQSQWNEAQEGDAVVEDAIAPPRKRKRTTHGGVDVDESIELRSSDLASWRDNYLTNMAEQSQKRQLGKGAHNAKIYAHKIVFEWGIGGELKNPELRALFSGGALAETFKSKPKAAKGTKEALIEREKAHAQDVGMHDEQLGLASENLDNYGPQVNDYDGVEVARDAEASYSVGEEFRTPMPWNKASLRPSQAGSQVGLQGFISAIFSSDGNSRAASLQPMSSSVGPGSFAGHGGSRMSASPLAGRNNRQGNLAGLELDHGNEEEDEERYLGHAYQGDENTGMDDFEFFGPGANIGTQDANASQWLNATMEKESQNFLEFVRTAYLQKVQEEVNTVGFITMDELVPPHQSHAIVAAQALQHILLLATRGFITVQQRVLLYGEIRIRLTTKA